MTLVGGEQGSGCGQDQGGQESFLPIVSAPSLPPVPSPPHPYLVITHNPTLLWLGAGTPHPTVL